MVNDQIKAAVLLTVGHLYANREDVVAGASVAALPNGAEYLLQPFKVYCLMQTGRLSSRCTLQAPGTTRTNSASPWLTFA